jgi:hypothetical protein
VGGFGWVRVAVVALVSAALVALAPTTASQAAPGDITLTGSISSTSGAEFRWVDVYGPGGWLLVNHQGDTFSVTGPPGEYTVYVYESGGPQGDDWSFEGETQPTLYQEDSTIQVTVPLHTLALDVQNASGSPVPANVDLSCSNATPPGWQYADTYANRDVNGVSSFLVANHAAGNDDCALSVQPDAGSLRTFRVPGNASTYTAVVNGGLHVQGTVSDGLGHAAPAGVYVYAYSADGQMLDSWTRTDAAGHYDLYVEPGSYRFDTSSAASSTLAYYYVNTTPIDVTSDRSLDLSPVIDTLTVHARTPGGQPAPSSAQLVCAGTPTGQTLIEWQSTQSVAVTGADLTLPGTSTDDGSCSLTLHPDAGLSSSTSVSIPNGGDEVTVVVNPGITITGQVTVPGIATFTDATVTVHSSSFGNSFTAAVAPDGSFTMTHVPPGDDLVSVDVNDATVGNFDFQRQMTLSDGDHVALAPDLDMLNLYLLGPTGDPGTGSARLSCSGDNGDVNSFTSTVTTRSGTGQLRLPGYAADGSDCSLVVTWADGTVVNRQVTLDPNVDTAVTLLRNGVTLKSDPFTSKDDDGVADALEAYAPNMGDGNSDGTPDYLQADVASLPEDGGVLGAPEADYLTVAGPDGSEMFSVATDEVTGARMAWGGGTQSVAGPPDGTELPKGFLDFEVRNVAPGSTTKVVIFYDSTARMNSYSTYNPANGAWSQLPANRVKINAKSIELTLTDGGIGDVDGLANGRVRHPGGGSRVDDVYPVVSGRALTAPNEKGWYDSSVTVRWSVTDDQAAAISAPPDTVVSVEGDDVAATSGQVCDRRGNCSTGQLQHLRIDKTPPSVTVEGPVDGAQYTLGSVPARRCSATDPGGSGVPAGSCDVAVSGGTSAGVGTVTATATATDRAGNVKRKAVTYTVVYDAGGLVAPAPGSKMKTFARGSTVVVRLKIRDAGGATVTPATAPAWVKPVAKGKATGKPNQPANDAKPDKGAVLIHRGQFWEYRWGTAAAKKGKAYVITVRLDDGTSRSVTVGIS